MLDERKHVVLMSGVGPLFIVISIPFFIRTPGSTIRTLLHGKINRKD